MDLIGLCAVPFLARPLLAVLLGPDPGVYESVLEGRGEAIHDFLLACAETAETSPGPVPNAGLGGREPSRLRDHRRCQVPTPDRGR